MDGSAASMANDDMEREKSYCNRSVSTFMKFFHPAMTVSSTSYHIMRVKHVVSEGVGVRSIQCEKRYGLATVSAR